MSEPLLRTEPVPAMPFLADGVTIRLAPPMARFSLRTRCPPSLEALVGTKVPTKIGVMEGGLACLGPDEWLLRTPLGTGLTTNNAAPIAVIDVSERAVCLIVEGPRAVEIMQSGCPLDLDTFAIGRATRTIFETVEIILIRESDTCFHVEVWRSFASWLWTAFITSACR
jgi:sarcosine oxidase, subunit gamma